MQGVEVRLRERPEFGETRAAGLRGAISLIANPPTNTPMHFLQEN
jgi:hypothetical protein